MMAANAEIKQHTRELLNGHWNGHVLVAAVLLAALFLEGAFLGLFGTSMGAALMAFFIGLILDVFFGLFIDGGLLYSLHLLRGEKAGIADVIAPFRMQPDRFLIVELLRTGVTLLLWAPYVLLLFSDGLAPVLQIVLTVLWAVLALAAYVTLRLLFGYSRLLLLEREDFGALAALRESRKLMKGRLLRLLRFCLAFIGYIPLGLCSLGLGFLWIIPYYMTAYTAFYEEVSKK